MTSIATGLRFLLALSCLALLACSDAETKAPKIPRAATGEALLGRVEAAQVDVYRVANGFEQTVCRTQSSEDTQVFERTGVISIAYSCIDDDSALYLLVLSGGWDADPEDKQMRSSNPVAFGGTLHLLATGAQLKNGDWSISPLSEVIYEKVKDGLAANADEGQLLLAMQSFASIAVEDVNGDRVSDYLDVLAWTIDDTDKLQVEESVWADYLAKLRTGDVATKARIATIASRYASEVALYGLGYYSAKQIHIEAGIAYIADGDGGLTIMDLRDNTPRLIANMDMFELTYDISVDNGIAALALGSEGIVFIDVSNPLAEDFSPKLLSKFTPAGEDFRIIEMKGDVLFLAKDEEVLLYDISVIDSPSLLATTLSFDAAVTDIQRKADRLYVGKERVVELASVFVYDIQAEATPTLVTNIGALVGIHSFAVGENYLAVIANYIDYDNLHIYDLVTGQQVGALEMEYRTEQITLSPDENYVYLMDDKGIDSFDIRDKTNPIRRAIFPVVQQANPGPQVPNVVGEVNYIYAIACYEDKLIAARENTLDAFRLEELATLRLVDSVPANRYAYNVEVEQDRLYVSENESGVTSWLLDADGLPVSSIDFGANTVDSIYVNGVLYAANWGIPKFYSLGEPNSATEIVSSVFTDATDFYSVSSQPYAPSQNLFAKHFAEVPAGMIFANNGVVTFTNVNDPLNPVPTSALISTDNTSVSAQDCSDTGINCTFSSYSLGTGMIAAYGNEVFLGNNSNLVRINASDIQNPVVIDSDVLSSVGIYLSVTAFAVDANYLYVAVRSTLPGIPQSILYILERDNYTEVGHVSLNESGIATSQQQMLVNDSLLVISQTNGIRGIDVSDPTTPQLLWAAEASSPNGIEIANEKLYVADGFAGVKIYSLQNLALP